MVARVLGRLGGPAMLCSAVFGLALLATAELQAQETVPPGAPGYCPPNDRPRRWSEEWYAREAQTPVGQRQVYKKGKLWPPFPRPTGKEQQFSHKYHAAHYWPYPYSLDDRAYVRNVSAMQTDNGWITATTLYDYHFEDDTQELNHAGRMQLRWILESAPIPRRTIHVQYGTTPEITERRLMAARQDAALIVGPEAVPPILVRITSPYGRPASEIVAIRRAELDSLPAPRIAYGTGSGSGSSGGGGGGGNSSQQQSGMP